jgi:hypothetical protein
MKFLIEDAEVRNCRASVKYLRDQGGQAGRTEHLQKH